MKSMLFPCIVLLAYSCTPTPDYYFSEPQPVNSRNLVEFPKDLQGTYRSDDSSSQLVISGNMMIEQSVQPAAYDKETFDSLLLDYRLNDTLIL